MEELTIFHIQGGKMENRKIDEKTFVPKGRLKLEEERRAKLQPRANKVLQNNCPRLPKSQKDILKEQNFARSIGQNNPKPHDIQNRLIKR